MAIKIDPTTGTPVVVTDTPFIPETTVPNSSNTREDESTKKELGQELMSILQEYGNMESDIPLNHKYWDVLNKFRSSR
jgi:hypothetical protein